MRPRVESQLADCERPLASGATQERLEPGDELGKGEGLGQVVVAAGAEAREPIGERIARGEEQHRRRHALGAQGLADVTAVGIGQPDVDDEEIRRTARHLLEELRARLDALGMETLLAQPADEHRTHPGVVLDDKDGRRAHCLRSMGAIGGCFKPRCGGGGDYRGTRMTARVSAKGPKRYVVPATWKPA